MKIVDRLLRFFLAAIPRASAFDANGNYRFHRPHGREVMRAIVYRDYAGSSPAAAARVLRCDGRQVAKPAECDPAIVGSIPTRHP